MTLRWLLIIACLLLVPLHAFANPKNSVTPEVPTSTRCVTADGLAYESCAGTINLSGADGAITDGVSTSIKATVKDYVNSNPLTTIIVDTNGDPATIGGGTQYQQGTAATDTDTVTLAGCVRADTAAVATGVVNGDRARCIVDATGRLWTHVGTIDGGTITSITNPVTITDGAGSLNVIVDSGTVAATQSGTWTVQPGNTANTTPWLFSIQQGGNTAAVNASSQLSVNCANCSGSGVSQQDNTGFTPGTTNFVPMGGEVDDTGTTAVTENNAGAARITPQRAVHMNLRNNSGTEIGVSGNPIIVGDGSGALNVIVDSSALPTGAATAALQDGIIKDGTGDTTQANVIGGRLQVENYNANLAADNSTNSTSKVPVLAGVATTAAPTYTTTNQVPLSLQTDGSLRAAVTNNVTIGTFPDNEPFNMNQIAGTTISTGVGASGTGTQRVASLIHDGTDTAQVTATAGGSLQVECTSGCGGSGGTSIADDAAFTPGTTAVTPAGAMFDDVTPDSVNEGDAGVLRMSANRNLYSTIRDAAGNERGANVNASNELMVAATGTVTANAGTNLNTSALLTTSAHDAAFGTAGSPDAQVRSIQGIASGTPVGVQSNGANLATEASVDGLEGGLGAAADAAATAGSTGSVTAKLRLMTSQLDAIQTAVQLIDDDQTGASMFHKISVGTTEDEHEVKGSAGRLFSISATNTNAAVRYLRCANQVIGSTTPGTTTVWFGLAIPGATTGGGFTHTFGPAGVAFSTGLTCWLVTGAAETDVAEVAANEINVNYVFK